MNVGDIANEHDSQASRILPWILPTEASVAIAFIDRLPRSVISIVTLICNLRRGLLHFSRIWWEVCQGG